MSTAMLARRAAPAVIAFGVLVLIVLGVDLSESAQRVREANPWWLLCAAAAVTLMRLSRAWRWGGLFPLVGLPRPRYREQVQIILAADFINIFVPRAATMAGRGLLASRVHAAAFGAVAATLAAEVAIDTALVMCVGVALLPYLVYPEQAVLLVPLAAVPAIAVATAGRAVPPALAAGGRALRRLPVLRRIGLLFSVAASARSPGYAGDLIRQALIGTIAVHACRIGVFVAAAYAIGGLPPLPVAAAAVLSTPAQLVPFTIGGAGVREGLLVLILANFGVVPELGVALGVTVLLVSSVTALVGAAVVPRLLFRRGRASTAGEVMGPGRAT